MDLDDAEDEDLCLPVADGRYLLTGRSAPHQAEHNGFEVGKGYSTGFVAWSIGLKLFLCWSALHHTPMCSTQWVKRTNWLSCFI